MMSMCQKWGMSHTMTQNGSVRVRGDMTSHMSAEQVRTVKSMTVTMMANNTMVSQGMGICMWSNKGVLDMGNWMGIHMSVGQTDMTMSERCVMTTQMTGMSQSMAMH
jgi:hypothetical protein